MALVFLKPPNGPMRDQITIDILKIDENDFKGTIVKINGTRYLSKICIWLRINIHKASFISDGIV